MSDGFLRLPVALRSIYSGHMEASQADNAAAKAVSDRKMAAHEALDRAKAEGHRQVEALAAQGIKMREDEWAPFASAIAFAEAEVTRLAGVERAALDRWTMTGALARRMEEFIRDTPGVFRVRPLPEAKLEKGQDRRGVILHLRTQLEVVEAEVERVELAPAKADDLAREVRASVADLASRYAPSVDIRIRGRDPAKLRDLIAQGSGPGFAGLAIWLLQDQLSDQLIKEIGDDSPGALSDAEQAVALSKLKAQRLDLEFLEESHLRAAEAEGLRIHRRTDASIEAILGLEVRQK